MPLIHAMSSKSVPRASLSTTIQEVASNYVGDLMAIGDVVYSFFAGFDLDVLDPVMDLLYTASYALLARGAVLQLHLLRDD